MSGITKATPTMSNPEYPLPWKNEYCDIYGADCSFVASSSYPEVAEMVVELVNSQPANDERIEKLEAALRAVLESSEYVVTDASMFAKAVHVEAYWVAHRIGHRALKTEGE